jgi:flagellar hook-length control protein FliK
MSLILASSSAPRPSTNPAPNASARGDAPAEDGAGSFGAALSRSLEPAGKIADKDGDKAAPAKRQADKAKTGVEDLINAMALGLVPLESRIVKAVPSGIALVPAMTTAALTATAGAVTSANTLAASAAAALAGLSTAAAPDGPATAAALNTDTARQGTLAPALAIALAPAAGATGTTSAVGAKAADPTALAAMADGASIALTPGVIANQNATPESGLGGQSDQRGSQGAIELTDMRAVKDASVDFTPVQTHSAARIPANFSTPVNETASINVAGSQTTDLPDLATASTDASLPAALLAPLPGAATLVNPAAPETTSTASLAPDVGSSEWGKSLGQQIVHMGKAGQPLAELQLNPPGLGPLKVTLSMNDQQMQASFVSAHASVRVAIEAALPQLRSTLADSGISLGNTSVSSESQQQQAFADRPGEQASPRSYRNSSAPDATALAARLAEPQQRLSASSVDIYA